MGHEILQWKKLLHSAAPCSRTIHYESKCTPLTCISQSHSLPFYQPKAFYHNRPTLKSYYSNTLYEKMMKHGLSNRLRHLIWDSHFVEQCTYLTESKIFSSYLIHLAYANEGLNLVRGKVMWEIGESTILFTLMGKVFSPVNQYGGLFSYATGRNEDSNETWIWPQHKRMAPYWNPRIFIILIYEHCCLNLILFWTHVFQSIYTNCIQGIKNE